MFGIDLTLSSVAVLAFIAIGLLLSFMILLARAKLISNRPVKLAINQTISKEVEGGQTLLSALSSEGIAVPSPCGGKATCKQCRVQVEAGGGDILETDRATFSPKELNAGWRLSCQCKVKNDMALKLPEMYLTLRQFEAKVVSNYNVATFIKELVVEVPADQVPDYQPGDYLQVHVPHYQTNTNEWDIEEQYRADWEKFQLLGAQINHSSSDEEVIRAYSMASYPSEGNQFKFNIRIATPPEKNIPWGICSSYMFSLKPGDTIQLSGPFGESHMIDDERDLIFLIGGAGSSFGRSHILNLFDHGTKRNVTLWYGARSLKENIYQDDFEKLEREHSNFSYNLVLSEPLPEDKWSTEPTKCGFLFEAFKVGMLDQLEEPENCLYYVCGPPLHNSSVMKLLDDYGVERESIVLDDFGS